MSTDQILPLFNTIQTYTWGSRTAIADFLGRPSPSSEPQAELWMGAHPRAPSRVRTPDGEVPLDAWIARDPVPALGPEVAARFGAMLPFLFKVLAAERPLSIQTHPDRAQARAGFAREERAGIPRDAPERSFPDPHPKPELICALTRFRALNRFRDPSEIVAAFERIGARELTRELAALRGEGRRGLPGFFASLLAIDPRERERLLARALEWARNTGEDPAARCLRDLADQFPADTSMLAPLVLNLVELAPGEAMFLPPGELHAYLGGLALELMASSDNVLRGGLTAKHVDVPELLAALADRCGPVERLRPAPAAGGEATYRTPAPQFALSVIDLRERGGFASRADHGVEILLCTEGECRLTTRDQSLWLSRGESVFVPASAPAYRSAGRAVLHRAAVPPS